MLSWGFHIGYLWYCIVLLLLYKLVCVFLSSYTLEKAVDTIKGQFQMCWYVFSGIHMLSDIKVPNRPIEPDDIYILKLALNMNVHLTYFEASQIILQCANWYFENGLNIWTHEIHIACSVNSNTCSRCSLKICTAAIAGYVDLPKLLSTGFEKSHFKGMWKRASHCWLIVWCFVLDLHIKLQDLFL